MNQSGAQGKESEYVPGNGIVKFRPAVKIPAEKKDRNADGKQEKFKKEDFHE
jgi:hypothetical protein